jgi:hypothetical protein
MLNCAQNWLTARQSRKAEMTGTVGFSVRIESWTVVDDGMHNAFTDLVAWQGQLWLAYSSSPSHFASKRSRIMLLRSKDAHTWEKAACFDGHGEDIRDPKLAVIHGRLTIFALLNRAFDPRPYRTMYSSSPDGYAWIPLAPAGKEGWLLGQPKRSPSGDWYAPAHNISLSAVELVKLDDDASWQSHASITNGRGADETAIEFQRDGSLLAVTRLEAGGGLFGHAQAGTLLRVAQPPYQTWITRDTCRTTRLDGPALFTHNGQVYAVGRFQPRISGPFGWSGSIFSRKRTAIFRVNETDLEWLADLPSAGDTSYAGVTAWNGKVYISYYTSRPERDIPWIMGMAAPTSIRIAILEGDL